MSVPSQVFNSRMVFLINEAGVGGENTEHLFIVAKEETYRLLAGRYPNVVHEPRMDIETVRKYDTGSEVLVLHSLFLNERGVRHLSGSQVRRTVWCVWGHDLYLRRIDTLSRRYKWWLADRRIANFRAIAVGYKYDSREIRRRFGNRVPVYEALYDTGYYNDDIDRIACKHVRTDRRTNIMIGHSGYDFLRHEKQLERLLPYRDEDILITLILCQGQADYTARVERRARELFPSEKLNIIHDFKPWTGFIDMLCDVDIAILDFPQQAAFGNMTLLSYLGKKLYLAPDGIMYHGFRSERVEVYDCTEIGCVPFAEFTSRPLAAVSDRSYIAGLLDRDRVREQWLNLFRTVAKNR